MRIITEQWVDMKDAWSRLLSSVQIVDLYVYNETIIIMTLSWTQVFYTLYIYSYSYSYFYLVTASRSKLTEIMENIITSVLSHVDESVK